MNQHIARSGWLAGDADCVEMIVFVSANTATADSRVAEFGSVRLCIAIVCLQHQIRLLSRCGFVLLPSGASGSLDNGDEAIAGDPSSARASSSTFSPGSDGIVCDLRCGARAVDDGVRGCDSTTIGGLVPK